MEARRDPHSDSSWARRASMDEASADADAERASASRDSISEEEEEEASLDWRMSFPTSADCSFLVRRAASRVWRSVTRSSAREAMRRAASSVSGDARRDTRWDSTRSRLFVRDRVSRPPFNDPRGMRLFTSGMSVVDSVVLLSKLVGDDDEAYRVVTMLLLLMRLMVLWRKGEVDGIKPFTVREHNAAAYAAAIIVL